MQFSVIPEISSWRQTARLAAFLTVVASIWLLWLSFHDAVRALGDTDDAMRVVLVRDLLHGRGWYDQLVTRIAPPQGAYFHWSRLIDGALAGLMGFAGLFVAPARAELIVRLVWPLLWIFPALLAALVIARNLGTRRSAVFIAAVLLALELVLYRQFRPGRVDHHDVQIVCALVALAVATLREIKPRFAVVAGLATALGLAVGLEALTFHAIVGASFAYRIAGDRKALRAAGAYGLALAIGAAGLYAIQSPPWRWDLTFCDALGANLVAGLVVAGLGFFVVARFGERLSDKARAALVGAVTIASASAYLVMNPACIRGPFAEVSPRLQQLWLDHVDELQPWTEAFARHQPIAIDFLAAMVMAGAAALLLWARKRRMVPEGVALAMLAVACGLGFRFARMQDYAFWFAIPIMAAGISLLVERWLKDKMVPATLVAVVLSPMIMSSVLIMVTSFHPEDEAGGEVPGRRCLDNAAFGHLANLPPGLVLADIDLGPAILANTNDDVVVGPYHRMSSQILAVHDVLQAPATVAELGVRRLKATYVVLCMKPRAVRAGSLIGDLYAGRRVPWLTKLSRAGEINQVWRVNRPLLAEGEALRERR